MFIPVILGTARKGRQSEKAAKYVLMQAKKAGIESELIDVRNYRINATDNSEKSPEAKKWEKTLKKADALIIVSPEYNHSIPGELKMFLDMLFKQYRNKPTGICAVSTGAFGGARAAEMLKLQCISLNMLPMNSVLYFPKIQELFNEKGKIKNESHNAMAKKFIEELVNLAESCKKKKEKINARD